MIIIHSIMGMLKVLFLLRTCSLWLSTEVVWSIQMSMLRQYYTFVMKKMRIHAFFLYWIILQLQFKKFVTFRDLCFNIIFNTRIGIFRLFHTCYFYFSNYMLEGILMNSKSLVFNSLALLLFFNEHEKNVRNSKMCFYYYVLMKIFL